MLFGSEVIERNNDDRTRRRKELTRINSHFYVALHPGHVAVIAALQPLSQESFFVY